MMIHVGSGICIVAAMALRARTYGASDQNDRIVALLDTEYQPAVKANNLKPGLQRESTYAKPT